MGEVTHVGFAFSCCVTQLTTRRTHHPPSVCMMHVGSLVTLHLLNPQASLPRLQDEERRLRAVIAASIAAAASDPAPLQDSSNRPGTPGGGSRPGTAGTLARPGTAASTACGTTARRSEWRMRMCLSSPTWRRVLWCHVLSLAYNRDPNNDIRPLCAGVAGSVMCPRALSSTGGLVVSATDRFTTYPYRPAAMAAEMNLRQVKRAGHATQTCSMRRAAYCCVVVLTVLV